MSGKRTQGQVAIERMQIAHKIAELNKAYGAIRRGTQGAGSVGREIDKLVRRQAELDVELEAHPPDGAAS